MMPVLPRGFRRLIPYICLKRSLIFRDLDVIVLTNLYVDPISETESNSGDYDVHHF